MPGATVDGRPLASQGLRLVARLIDGVLLAILGTALSWPQLHRIFQIIQDYVNSLPKDSTATPDTSALTQNSELLRAILLASVIWGLTSAVYTVVMIGLRGATLGKMIVGVKVTQRDRDVRPSWGQAVLRWAATDVPSLLLSLVSAGWLYSLLDSLWCLWDKQRQCLHDKAARTVVVRSR